MRLRKRIDLLRMKTVRADAEPSAAGSLCYAPLLRCITLDRKRKISWLT